MNGRKIRSTFTSRGHRNGSVGNNDHYFARQGYNGNIDHYRSLHHPDRKRSPAELERMERAAQRRPGGWAAKFLAGTLTRPDWAADNVNGETTARSIAEASA